jgi:quercetin dioxygenase-like cupin family protein
MSRLNLAIAVALTCAVPMIHAHGASVTPHISKPLPEMPGKEGVMATVVFPPNHVDPVHRHDAHGFVYVLEGTVVMQVEGGKEVTLKPGQTFYESPTDLHVVGKNASSTEPAKLLVFFIKNQGAPLLREEPSPSHR